MIASFVTAIISAIFSASLIARLRRRGGAHHAAWAVALALFSLAVLAQGLFLAGWREAWLYRLWYFSGALTSAAYLGVGSLYLAGGSRWGHPALWAVTVAALYALGRVLVAPVELERLSAQTLSGAAMPAAVRLLSPFFHAFGTAAVVGTALHSAFAWMRRRTDPAWAYRALGSTLVALGVAVIAAVDTLLRLGVADLFALGQLVGIATVFAGYRLATRPSGAARARWPESA
ncbi:MAG TPA: hypothetical protein VF234_00735 [Limnochordia bacterium]